MKLRSREHTYRSYLEWTGAAQGTVRDYASYSREYRIAFAGKPVLTGSADAAFRGDGRLHNPEDLLVAALSSCHMLAYLALCARAGVIVASYQDDAVGTMEEAGGAGRFTRVMLRPRVAIVGGDPEQARALHERAHAECFIAASVNFPVDLEPVIERAGDPA